MILDAGGYTLFVTKHESATAGISEDKFGRLVLLANRFQLTYWAIRWGGAAMRAIPTSISYPFARILADCLFSFWPEMRRRTTENYLWVLGPTADFYNARAFARASFRNYLTYFVDFLRFPGISNAEMLEMVELRGSEHLRQAMALGRGVIAVGFHVGNIDLGAALLGQQGYPVNVVVDRFEPPRLDKLIQDQRRARGLALIPVDRAPRQALRILRKGEILALLIDKPTPGEGMTIRIFGGSMSIPAGAAFLSWRTGAPIVPCRVIRRPDNQYRAEIGVPIDPKQSQLSGKQVSVDDLAQRMATVLEDWVRDEPTKWYPFRRLWTERPRHRVVKE